MIALDAYMRAYYTDHFRPTGRGNEAYEGTHYTGEVVLRADTFNEVGKGRAKTYMHIWLISTTIGCNVMSTISPIVLVSLLTLPLTPHSIICKAPPGASNKKLRGLQ